VKLAAELLFERCLLFFGLQDRPKGQRFTTPGAKAIQDFRVAVHHGRLRRSGKSQLLPQLAARVSKYLRKQLQAPGVTKEYLTQNDEMHTMSKANDIDVRGGIVGRVRYGHVWQTL